MLSTESNEYSTVVILERYATLAIITFIYQKLHKCPSGYLNQFVLFFCFYTVYVLSVDVSFYEIIFCFIFFHRLLKNTVTESSSTILAVA